VVPSGSMASNTSSAATPGGMSNTSMMTFPASFITGLLTPFCQFQTVLPGTLPAGVKAFRAGNVPVKTFLYANAVASPGANRRNVFSIAFAGSFCVAAPPSFGNWFSTGIGWNNGYKQHICLSHMNQLILNLAWLWL